MIRFLSVLLLSVLAVAALAQDDTDVAVDTFKPADTVLYEPARDTSVTVSVSNPADYETRLTQNPTIALFKSMFVPGLGQIGNRKYLKAGLIIAVESYFIYKAVDWGMEASDRRDRWQAADDISLRNQLYADFDDARDQRNKFYWFTGITIFLSMFDAYVDAHLSGSPREQEPDRVSFDVGPDLDGGARAVVTYSF